MNNTITSMSSVNFQAKLDVSRVKGSKQRWQNVAKIFEDKTKKIAGDVLELTGSFSNGLEVRLKQDGLYAFDEAFIYKKSSKKLKNLSDKEVAKNIVDVFKFIRNIEPTNLKIGKLATKLRLDKITDSNGSYLEFKFYDIMNEVLNVDKQKFIKDHPVFHEGGIDI